MNSKKDIQRKTKQGSEFLDAMQGVKPLKKNDRIDLQAQQKKKPAFFKKQQEFEPIPDQLSDEWEVAPVDYEETIKFAQDGIGYKQMHALKTGNVIVEDHLDLHGYTIQEARQVLVEFIHFAQTTGARCVRIVHGKGYKAAQRHPIIKNKINSWLRQHPDVLAFHSATPKDGGNGAVYVLIKRLQE